MSERITALITSDGSFTYTTPLIEFYQGSAYDLYLDVQFEKELEKGTAVQIMFRRSDGKPSPWLLMDTADFVTYTLKMDSDWYWAKEGDLTFTVQAYKKLDEKTLTVKASSYSSWYVNPAPTFYELPPLAPNAYQGIITDLAENQADILELQESNPVVKVEGNINPTIGEGGRPQSHLKIKYFDGDEEKINVKLPTELATKQDVDAKIMQQFNALHPVTQIRESDKDLEIVVSKYGITDESVKIKADSLVSNQKFDREITKLSDGLVVYDKLEGEFEPAITVTKAELADRAIESEFAEKDSDGNIISETYVKNAPEFAKTDVINTFEQPQVFTERIDIKNVDGTYDSIKHINNNFLISSSDGTNIMDLDSGLGKVSFFGKELDLDSNLDSINNKPVFVEVRIAYFNVTYTIPYGKRVGFTFIDDETGMIYACSCMATETSATVFKFIPLNDGPTFQPDISVVNVIRIGDL